MWASLGLLGLLALVIVGGAWLAIRMMEEQERYDTILAVLPPKEQHPVNAEDDPDENRLYWLTEKGWDQ